MQCTTGQDGACAIALPRDQFPVSATYEADGDGGTTVITKPDGTKIVINSDGKIEAVPEGTIIEKGVDTFGRSQLIITLPDGTKIEIIFHPEGRIIIVDYPDGSGIRTYPDGSTVAKRPDGTIIETYPDGTRVVTRPDGTEISYNPDGTRVVTRPDGTTIAINPEDKTTTISHPDGNKVHIIKNVTPTTLPEPVPEFYGEPMPDSEKRHTNIYFANGMNSSFAEARVSQQLLGNIYKATLDTFFPGTYSFHLAYNVSFKESFKEKYVHSKDRTEIGAQVDMMRNNPQQWQREIKDTAEAALDAVKAGGRGHSPQKMDMLKEGEKEGLVSLKTIQIATRRSHVIQYLSALRAEKRVFVVSHSQGNLFTNTALRSTAQAMPRCAPSLEQIGVGTPAPRAAQFRPFYQTAFDDLVINYARRWLYGNVVPGNVDNDLSSAPWRDVKNHAFRDGYMQLGLPSRRNIDVQMYKIAAVTLFPADYCLP